MNPSPITLVIADDHPVVRAGIAAIVHAYNHFRIIGEASSFEELAQQLRREVPDVLVLDLNGMGVPPLTMVSRICRQAPACHVIIFSSAVDLAPELLELGIAGYVVKENLGQDLVAAINAAIIGRRYLSVSVSDYIERLATARGKQQLTGSELQVLGLLAQGQGTIKIAETTHLEPRSVQNYITRLRRKTGCTERTQLVEWYRRNVQSNNSEEQ